MQSFRFAAACLALGVIALWGSEMLFWTAPKGPVGVLDLALTWLAYALASGCALGAVLVTGCGGLRGAFLGGAILGWLVEGVVVGTIYDAFPFQLVWTPLAWHALVTGVMVFALARAASRWPLAWQVGAMLALGAFGGVWGWFWPVERSDLPGFRVTFFYLFGIGLLVPPAQMVLDRILPGLRPPRLTIAAPWGLAALAWLVVSATDPRPTRLALPVLLAATLWAMRWLGQGDVRFGGPAAQPWRHLPMLIAPLTAAVVAVAGWQRLGPVAVNVPIALLTGAIATLWWLRLLWQAYGVRRVAIAARRSSAPS